ncbi:MAG TPA: preprotein translocase subunit SecG [Verrucomicrobiae bacterium]|nr:preprotein translocase subunit SecG [Verrucomicrobiae bacterium]
MGFIIGLLTLVMVLDCVILVLLVLIQLPKKEAGAGLAFGGAASDALFGAGSGNVLTKITKYAAAVFFALAIALALIQARRTTSTFEQRLEQPVGAGALPPASQQAPSGATTPTPPGKPPVQLTATNLNLLTPTTESSNAAPAATNAPAAK